MHACKLRPYNITQDLDVDKKFDKLEERTLITKELYQLFSGWMIKTYKISKGKHKGKPLNVSCVRAHLNTIINEAKQRFLTSQKADTIRFSNAWTEAAQMNHLRTSEQHLAHMFSTSFTKQGDTGSFNQSSVSNAHQTMRTVLLAHE